MVRLSIIIPALGSRSAIDETLLSVLENRPHSCQVIVPHAPHYVDPYDLHDEVQFVSTGGSVTSLCNAAFQVAAGEVIHCLLPGMVVETGWSDLALERFAGNRNIGSLVPSITSMCGEASVHGVVYHPRCGKQLVRNLEETVSCPLLAVGYYRLAAIRFMRGYDPQFGQLADIELGFRMRAAGYENVLEPSILVRSNSVPHFSPRKGYRGGLLRGRLARLAQQHGINDRCSRWHSVWSECLNHHFSPAAVAAVWGRLTGQKEQQGPPAVRSLHAAVADKPARRRAA